jgi:hypothetical protein
MRCLYCAQRAGIFRRTCAICAHVAAVVDRAGAEVGLVGLVDIFAAEGLRREQVDRVLDAEIGGNPTLRDRMTSQMANLLMRNLGMPGRQSPEDVQRVRMNMATGEGEGVIGRAGEVDSDRRKRLSRIPVSAIIKAEERRPDGY